MQMDLANTLGGGLSVRPQSLSGTTTVNGTWVDMGSTEGPVMGEFTTGAATGTPSSYTVACKLQQADDASGTNAEDITNQNNASIAADATRLRVTGRRTRRFVRCVATPAFSGGSSPTVPVAANLLAANKSL